MYKIILVCFLLTCLVSGCTKDHAPDSNDCQTCATISFKADIVPIFSTNCALSGCHSGSSSNRPKLDSAEAYADATEAGTGYVVTGNANYSIIYTQLPAGAPNHMPEGGQLDNCDMEKIYCWIQQGALNN